MTEHSDEFAFEDTEAEDRSRPRCPNTRWFEHDEPPAETCRSGYCASCCRSYRAGQLGARTMPIRCKECTTPMKGKP